MRWNAFSDLFLLGTWSLRCTNDPFLNSPHMITRLQIERPDEIELSCYQKMGHILGQTKKMYGTIRLASEDEALISFGGSEKQYSSIWGVELPIRWLTFPSSSSLFQDSNINRISYQVRDRTLLVKTLHFYYVFDLLSRDEWMERSPYVETKLDSFLVLQLLSFWFNQELVHLLSSHREGMISPP